MGWPEGVRTGALGRRQVLDCAGCDAAGRGCYGCILASLGRRCPQEFARPGKWPRTGETNVTAKTRMNVVIVSQRACSRPARKEEQLLTLC